jgi:gluconokinase
MPVSHSRRELGTEKLELLYQRTGTPLHVSYALPQLRAFYANPKNQPIAKQIDRWQTLSTICLNRWLGNPCIQMPISYSEASWTGMFDFRSCSWDDEASNLLENCPGITRYEEEYEEEDEIYKDEHIELLPPLADFDTLLPILKEGVCQFNQDGSDNVYWQNWPEFRAQTLSLFLGIGDGAAANLGTKCGPGRTVSATGERPQQRIAVTIGTSAAARVCLPLPSASAVKINVPAGLFCYRVSRDTILLGGALTDGGSVVEWARSLLNLQSPESFDACMTQVADMYNERCSRTSQDVDVTMVPFLSGERSTGYRTGARACISGLTRDSTSNDFMYASLESVVLRLGQVLRLISEACATQRLLRDATNFDGANVENMLVASGTALERNALWRRMLADCTSLDVMVDGDSAEEAASRGVAMLLAASLQEAGECNKRVYGDIEQPLVVADETKHNPIAVEHWNKRLKSQESVLDAISSTWK